MAYTSYCPFMYNLWAWWHSESNSSGLVILHRKRWSGFTLKSQKPVRALCRKNYSLWDRVRALRDAKGQLHPKRGEPSRDIHDLASFLSKTGQYLFHLFTDQASKLIFSNRFSRTLYTLHLNSSIKLINVRRRGSSLICFRINRFCSKTREKQHARLMERSKQKGLA